MVQANNCIFLVDLEGLGDYTAVLCIRSVRFTMNTTELPSTKYSDGKFRDYVPGIHSYNVELEGATRIDQTASAFDLLSAQIGFITLPFQLKFIDDANVDRTVEGECIVAASELAAAASENASFNFSLTGKGDFLYDVDGEPGDGGSPGDGDDPDEDAECDIVINDGLFDILIAPNVPLQPDQYLVSINNVTGADAPPTLYGWRLDGGVWHWESNSSFLLPFIENGSYTLDLVAQCANGGLSNIVTKTLDVAVDPPADCDGTIDDITYTYVQNPDGSYAVTFRVEVSSPTETLVSMQYKLDSGPNMELWQSRPVVDGVAIFTDEVPDLAFQIDARTRCANGGLGFSVEDGGTIPEPSTCDTTIEVHGYYLTYSYDTYSASAVINYILSDPIEDIVEIQWFSTVTGAWVKVADAAEPIIVIPVVPGTLTNQQFRVVCSATNFGPITTILISVPIKQAQLDSRIINYTDIGAHYDVIINGTTNISQGNVAANDMTEFNYYGILNVPVTVRLTLDTPVDAEACVLITNNTTYTGVVDGGDPNSIDFSVTVTYGIVIAFWAVEEIIPCATTVTFNGYGIRHDSTAGNWIINPIYTVTDNVDPTAIIEYWNGSAWVELGDANTFEPLEFTMPDNTATEVKLRAKCSEGSFGPESDPINVVAPEFASWVPAENSVVINYSYTSQEVYIEHDDILIFYANMSPRTAMYFNITTWDPGNLTEITTMPGYPRIPSDLPDPLETWYTGIWKEDNYVGSYSHAPGDPTTIHINGAGVDLAEGVVFTIQTAETPIEEEVDYIVESVDYTFDPDGGDFEGFPVFNAGTEWFQYSTDDGATWNLQYYTVPIIETGLETGDEVWVRGSNSDGSEFGDTFIVTVESCSVELSDFTPFILGYNATGTADWLVTFMYTASDYGDLENIEFYAGGSWNPLDITSFTNDRAISIVNYFGKNDETVVQAIRAICVDGKIGEAVNVPIVFPDFFSWTPTNNSAILNFGSTTETYSIYVGGGLVASGTTSPHETSEVFNFTTGPSGLTTVKVTLGTSVPDPTHFTLATPVGAVNGTYFAIVDPGDAQSILFENVDLTQTGTTSTGFVITFWQ
jgi:predicted secreted protein